MKTTRILEGFALVLTAWVLWITLIYLAYVAAPIWQVALDSLDQLTGNEPVFCAEDDSCWDCRTMGNMVCGPTEGK